MIVGRVGRSGQIHWCVPGVIGQALDATARLFARERSLLNFARRLPLALSPSAALLRGGAAAQPCLSSISGNHHPAPSRLPSLPRALSSLHFTLAPSFVRSHALLTNPNDRRPRDTILSSTPRPPTSDPRPTNRRLHSSPTQTHLCNHTAYLFDRCNTK